jgi:methylenetetrahydrofolate reductase (NADPH)
MASTTGPEHPINVSFEFFPPKTPEMEETLWNSMRRLEPLAPSFVSVTYGAGGSTRHRTHEVVRRILSETTLIPAAHLTCVESSRGEIDEIADTYWDAGVRHLVALRGDPPAGEEGFVPPADGYRYASELVEGLRRRHDFEISVACYPEGHPEAPSLAFDIENLKRKVDAGATRAMTQFFFDNDLYFRFREQCARARINVPIVPGIMPITNLKQTIRFAANIGASVPDFVHEAFDGLDNEPDLRQYVAMSLATDQVRGLAAEGVDDFHFYTLNRAELTYTICHLLGMRPQPIESVSGAA